MSPWTTSRLRPAGGPGEMAFWLLLATLMLVCHGGFSTASQETSRGPRITSCRSPQLETITCYWTYGDFENLSTTIKFQYKTSDHQWNDCPDTESAGRNSCDFSKENTSVLWNYHIRLIIENVTFDERSFVIDEIERSTSNSQKQPSSMEEITRGPLQKNMKKTFSFSTAGEGERERKQRSKEGLVLLNQQIHLLVCPREGIGAWLYPVQRNQRHQQQHLRFKYDPPGWPRITECRSSQLEIFTCHWTYGEFQNLTGLLKLQYLIPGLNWTDCPDTVSAGENGCYFSKNYTSIWVHYRVRLVSDNDTYYEHTFTIDEIDPPGWPRITECRSSQLETFTCHWTYGEFQNLTGLLKLQYLIPGLNWTDCPDTVSAGENGCFFSENYTSIWVHYRVRLVSDNVTYYEHTFTIDEIEQPTSNPLAVSTKVPLQKIMKKIYPPGWPIITECRSPQQETFTCHWTYGEFHNLTGLLRLQYRKPGLNWTDCPDTVSAGENGCYFNETYTSIWVGYQVRLISDNATFYEYSFTVDGIVRPDPPRALNWTALNISGTRLHMDIELNWLPPATADVKSGWITLEYEAHVMMANGTKWKTYDSKTTHISIYGLRMGSEYWVKIRCKQKENTVFSEFSEVLIIQLPSKFPDSPWPLFVIVGLFAIVVAMAFFIFCKKDRLKLLILPPVPVPKIKGIDPALLQKGKLDEVSSILASHESYKQQLCIDDPWVEFIELDLDEQDEKNEGADTDRLLGEEYPKTHSCLGVKDDDSGRASCCEPDIPETDFSNSEICDGTSDTGQTHNTKDNQADLMCLSDKPNSGGIPTNSQMPNVEKPSTMPEEGKLTQLLANGTTNVPPSTQLSSLKPSMDFYALVSDITPAGRLLLSPGQRIKMENEECSEPADTQRPTTLNQGPTTLNQHPTTLNQHPTTLNMDNAYISESAVTAFHSVNFPTENAPQNPSMDSYFTPESLIAAAMSSRASEKASGYEAPVADYTSVHITNSPQNLVLNTTAPPGKEFTPPCGYMSTDQVNKVMP